VATTTSIGSSLDQRPIVECGESRFVNFRMTRAGFAGVPSGIATSLRSVEREKPNAIVADGALIFGGVGTPFFGIACPSITG
jgi:hypothetical protein